MLEKVEVFAKDVLAVSYIFDLFRGFRLRLSLILTIPVRSRDILDVSLGELGQCDRLISLREQTAVISLEELAKGAQVHRQVQGQVSYDLVDLSSEDHV